jgi:hypothetical protein
MTLRRVASRTIAAVAAMTLVAGARNLGSLTAPGRETTP